MGHDPSSYERLRQQMVTRQLRSRGLSDDLVLAAMGRVAREAFVPENLRHQAYVDGPLTIGEGQTISQPYIVAYMSELAGLQPGQKVLEIGTGSGYQTAVLAELGAEVFTIERIGSLAAKAKAVLDQLKYTNIHYRIGDGFEGWQEQAPFDCIILTAAPPQLPTTLISQLAEGGVMIAPVGVTDQQYLKTYRKRRGDLFEESHFPVRFVPMLPDVQK